MKNVLDKCYREDQNTHFMFNKFFSENGTVYEIMSKHIVETEGPQMTSQHGAYALRARLASLHACMRMHMPTRPGTHMHARSARMHTQANKCNTYCFFTATMIRKRPSVLRYTYIAPRLL